MDDQPSAARVWHRVVPSRTLLGPALLVSVAVAGAFTALAGTEDANDALGAALLETPWLPISAVGVLLLLAAAHFVSAAFALRAVSGRRLSLRPTTFAQVAAAATNRIVPNGIGGAGLNLRYLLRAGVSPGAAATGLAALALVGGATDAGYVAAVTALGPAVGLPGAAGELQTLTAGGVQAGQQHLVVLVAAIAALSVVVVVRSFRHGTARFANGVRQAFSHGRDLLCHPARLGAAGLASAATTVAVSAGFVLAVEVWGHAATPLQPGALVAVYLVAAAAGGATPLPSFFVVTEAALVGALVLAGYSSGSALVAVLIFRAVTYWLPLPVGLWMGQRLRKTKLL
ncbi:MAG: hypothetical protein QOE84_3684 [Actinomycetota bacterium]|jgi:uncharacterized membrane protein YbhN (UPF0104 family)|nr:hypothetical protein [Actinomycetota bacterium]